MNARAQDAGAETPAFSTDFMRRSTRALTSAIFEEARRISATRGGRGVTRTAYSAEETALLDALERRAVELGLECAHDAAGNRFFTCAGRDRTLPALWCGSHADSVFDGGNYDGLAGIAAGFAAVAAWRAEGMTPKRDFVVCAFRAEEPGLLGSEALLGRMSPETLTRRIDPRPDAPAFGELVRSQGLDPNALAAGRPLRDLSKVAGFLELHIEQAPSLDADPVVRTGLVTGIRGRIAWDVIEVAGEAAHAGAIERGFRRDAVAAAAEVVSRMNAWWDERLAAGADLVLTFGVFSTPETAVFNKIAGSARLSFEARSLDVQEREAAGRRLKEVMAETAERFNVVFRTGQVSRLEPQRADERLLEALEQSAQRAGVAVRRLASGAGHDAQNFGVSGIPFAMIFVANANGSHNPDEAMQLDDFERGAALIAELARTF